MRFAISLAMVFLLQQTRSGVSLARYSLASLNLPAYGVGEVRAKASADASASTRLSAGFLDDLQMAFVAKRFSTMNTGSTSQYYTIGLTGSGGLIGTALRNELRRCGGLVNGKPVRVVCLARGIQAERVDALPANVQETRLVWNPKGTTAADILCPTAIEEIDTIIHLSGDNVSTGLGRLGFLGLRPWTDEKKQSVLDSRVLTTEALAKAIAAGKNPTTFLCASGIGVYGSDFIGGAREPVDETANTSNASGFLAVVSRQWEAATTAAARTGNRVVNMRIAVVISKRGGVLGKLYPVFLLGGGGTVGSGQQYTSFISARDIARAIIHVMETPSLQGPVNLAAPVPCTNAEFTKALGSALNRPTILPLPSFAVSLLFGEMGEELLLGGTRAVGRKLLQSGFEFLYPTIADAIQIALQEEEI